MAQLQYLSAAALVVLSLVSSMTPAAEKEPIIIQETVPGRFVVPTYPKKAKELVFPGKVRLRFTILETGIVADPVIVDSDPAGMFDDAVLDAFPLYWFYPAIDDCKAARRAAELVFVFNPLGDGKVTIAELLIDGISIRKFPKSRPNEIRELGGTFSAIEILEKSPQTYIHPSIVSYWPAITNAYYLRGSFATTMVAKYSIDDDGSPINIDVTELIVLERRHPGYRNDARGLRGKLRAHLSAAIERWRFSPDTAGLALCEIFYGVGVRDDDIYFFPGTAIPLRADRTGK